MKLLFVTVLIAAQSPSALAEPTAEELYGQGQHAYDRANYVTAILYWQRSYDLSAATGLLFNIAQAFRLSGDCLQAITTYRRFVEIDPKADQRPLAIDFIHELEPTCGVPAHAPSVDRPSAKPGLTMKRAGLATGGAGVILLVTGVAFGYQASTLGDEVTRDCAMSCDWSNEKAKENDGHRDATVGKVLDGIGLAAIAAGIGIYIYSARDVEPALAIQPGTRGATLSWSGRW